MSWNSDYNRSEDVAKVLLEIEKRRKRGEPFHPVTTDISRGAPSHTFWGRAWCANLESYSDYENRLPRGRSYLRNGNVYDLEVSEGFLFAYVAGTSLYEVEITIAPLEESAWSGLKSSLSGEVANLVDLLAGRLGDTVMRTLTSPEAGLFPAPDEIQINCNCPDWAGLCKHAAAVLYATAVQFDSQPDLFFTLRGVDHTELISSATSAIENLAAEAPDDNTTSILAPDDLSELFGIEITDPGSAFGDR